MNIKEWYAAAEHCGIIYAYNRPSREETSARICLWTIVHDKVGPRLERAWPEVNGEYSEKLAKELHFRSFCMLSRREAKIYCN